MRPSFDNSAQNFEYLLPTLTVFKYLKETQNDFKTVDMILYLFAS